MSSCPNCGGAKGKDQYLCRGCWFGLRIEVRRRLLKHDRFAIVRVRELYEQTGNSVPLEEIEVSA
jgi:uncharacterized membrane protein YvbJ